jgi:CheY-like chemotaxis protein
MTNTPTPTRKLRILLVEDHADTLESVTLLLRKFGHEVLTAANCAQARAHAAAQPAPSIEAVVGDLGLPDGDGLDLLVELKRQYNCPTIALTAYGMDADLKRCAAAGVDRHLLKPVGVVELARALTTLCPQPAQ